MSSRRRPPKRQSARSRLDGARHWKRTLDQYVALHLMAGVSPKDIRKAMGASLRRHRRIERHPVPPVEVLEHSRLLTHWRTDPAFLDSKGIPRPLALKGKASFTSLAKAALSDAVPGKVLRNLRRHRLVTIDKRGLVCLQSDAFLLKGLEKGHALGYSLSTLEGIMGTTYSNIIAADVAETVGRFHRSVFAERFDRRHLPAYDRFLREEGIQFVIRQDQWLKGRESRYPSRRARAVYVGCGLFGIRSF